MTNTYERALPFTLRDAGDDDGLTLEGYAAVFNSPTRINDWAGEYDEVISPGAFAKTIRERKPVLQFDHGKHPLFGSLPIGSITDLREDAQGLFVRARLHDSWMTEPLRQAISSQAVSGMSFRFTVPDGRDSFQKRAGDVDLRTIREVKLFELGPVVFPAYDATSVALRSLSEIFPGEITVVHYDDETAPVSTSDDAAAERSTSDDAAVPDAPAPTPLVHPTRDEMDRLRREIETFHLGIRSRNGHQQYRS